MSIAEKVLNDTLGDDTSARTTRPLATERQHREPSDKGMEGVTISTQRFDDLAGVVDRTRRGARGYRCPSLWKWRLNGKQSRKQPCK